ncbi:hypothetical protein ACJJIK_18555 [Microbulbifer sp. ZKSA006]|uniref:hypothetical protein n=1 Tax=Microbulbifer sp. ZKSA006 TaxID=3243390 RepID=UPI00403A5A38
MSIDAHATKARVDQLIGTALVEIKSGNVGSYQKLTSIVHDLSFVMRDLDTAKDQIHHYKKMVPTGHGPEAYRAKQSINSKLETISSLEVFLIEQWEKVRDALQEALKKAELSIGGRNKWESLAKLFKDIQAFDKKFNGTKKFNDKISPKEKTTQIAKLQSIPYLDMANTKAQMKVIQKEINQLKEIPIISAPIMLAMITLTLQLFALYFLNLNNK